jgi:hypothetical protein
VRTLSDEFALSAIQHAARHIHRTPYSRSAAIVGLRREPIASWP